MKPNKRIFVIAGIFLAAILMVAAFRNNLNGTGTETENMEDMEMSEGHDDDHGEEGEEHSPAAHMDGHVHEYIPEDAMSVENPFEANEESIALGAEAYSASCAICHGETGEGDGPAAEGLETAPADLHASHVVGLSDGGLFWVISHGKPDTPMPAWENILTVDQRWHVINFLRSLES